MRSTKRRQSPLLLSFLPYAEQAKATAEHQARQAALEPNVDDDEALDTAFAAVPLGTPQALIERVQTLRDEHRCSLVQIAVEAGVRSAELVSSWFRRTACSTAEELDALDAKLAAWAQLREGGGGQSAQAFAAERVTASRLASAAHEAEHGRAPTSITSVPSAHVPALDAALSKAVAAAVAAPGVKAGFDPADAGQADELWSRVTVKVNAELQSDVGTFLLAALRYRWMEHLDPRLQRGEFSDGQLEQIETLVRAGSPAEYIATQLSKGATRVTTLRVQLWVRKYGTLDKPSLAPWAVDEDNLLRQLVTQNSADGWINWWPVVAGMRCRTRENCRGRYKVLMRHDAVEAESEDGAAAGGAEEAQGELKLKPAAAPAPKAPQSRARKSAAPAADQPKPKRQAPAMSQQSVRARQDKAAGQRIAAAEGKVEMTDVAVNGSGGLSRRSSEGSWQPMLATELAKLQGGGPPMDEKGTVWRLGNGEWTKVEGQSIGLYQERTQQTKVIDVCRNGDCGWNAQGELVTFRKKNQHGQPTASMQKPESKARKEEEEALMRHGSGKGPPKQPVGQIWRWDGRKWSGVDGAPLIQQRKTKKKRKGGAAAAPAKKAKKSEESKKKKKCKAK